MKTPATNGPKTDPICHDILLQLVALGKCSLGTINPKRENIDGLKNERRIPPIKTKK